MGMTVILVMWPALSHRIGGKRELRQANDELYKIVSSAVLGKVMI